MKARAITREEIHAAVRRFADPFLYRRMREDVEGPRCDFCNLCFAHGAEWPIDCYNEEVAAQKKRMLHEETDC